jgi:hypothetical protein
MVSHPPPPVPLLRVHDTWYQWYQISSRSSGGSTHHRRTEQDIIAEKMEQRMSENEEYTFVTPGF